MPEQNLLDFTGIRYYDQWFKAHFPDKFATRADLEEVAALAASAYRFMGKVPSKDALPEDAAIGDVYAVGETGDQYAWTGEAWDKVTLDLHLENYVKKGQWVPQGGAMSTEDKTKLDGVQSWADRVAVDIEPDASVDGDDGALVGASLTIYVASVAGEEPAVGLASETATGTGSSTTVVFYMPRDSVPAGSSITLKDVIMPRFGAEGAPAVKSARLEDASALEYTPGSGTKKTQGLRLDVAWQSGSGNTDGPTDAFGTFDVEWSVNATMGTVNMLLRWNFPSEKAYCSILFRRAGGLPIGIRQNIGKPGLGRSVMIKTDGMTSKELALSTVVAPAANSPLSGGQIDPNADGMTFNCASLDPISPLPAGQVQNSPYAQFRGVEIINKTWREEGQHGDVGDFRLVWQLAEPDRQAPPNTYIATFYWEQAGALKGRGMSFVLLSDTDAVGTSGRLWAFLPVRASIAVPAGGSQDLSAYGVEIIASDGLPLPEGMARAYLRSDSEALSFDGSVLTEAGDYRYFPEQGTSGIRLVWEDASGNQHGPTDEYGTFSVCWTLAAVNKASNAEDAPIVSRTYTVDIAWCPNVLKVYHVLANYAAKQALDDRLSGANADRATAQKNGTMSGPDKEKLDSIEPGANRYIASEHVATDATLGLVKVDASIRNSVNPVRNDAVYSALAGKVDSGALADMYHDGLLSGDLQAKLNSVEYGANCTTVDDALKPTSRNPVQNKVVCTKLDDKINSNVLAGTSQNGLLSGDGQAKLNSCEPGANNYVLPQATDETLGGVYVDEALNSSSTNPVQNKAVYDGVQSILQAGRPHSGASNFDGILLSVSGGSSGAPEVVFGAKSFAAPISGDVTSGTVTNSSGAVVVSAGGNATTASRLKTARTISLTGGASGSAAFDGSSNAVINTTVSGLVPPASSRGFVLGLDANKAVKWIAPPSEKYLLKSSDQTVKTKKNFVDAPLVPAPDQDKSAVPMFYLKDMLRASVERASGGGNTVIWDAKGNPHHMVVFPKIRCEDIDPSGTWGLGTGVHPAFIVNGREVSEIFVGKYLASGDRSSGAFNVRSVPGGVPVLATSDDGIGLDKSIKNNLGKGFSLNTAANWGLMALLSLKARGLDSPVPGNTSGGKSAVKPWQTGLLALGGDLPRTTLGYTLTGSGPQEWTHDGTPGGVCDTAGNMRERLVGLYGKNGNISLIPDNNAIESIDTADGAYYLALNADGSLSNNGEPLYVTTTSNKTYVLSTATASNTREGKPFNEFTFAGDIDDALTVLRRLAIFPPNTGVTAALKGSMFWSGNANAPIFSRGGCWNASALGSEGGDGIFSLFVGTGVNANSALYCFGIRIAYLP